jgi:hypothetical protein
LNAYAVTVSVANGAASASYTLPASTPGGTYTIQAVFSGTSTLLGSSDTSHSLTISNVPTTTAATSTTTTFSTATQTVALSATVTSPAGIVNEGTETFSILSGTTVIGSPVTVAVVGGAASAGYPLPGGTSGGTYTIQAVYNANSSYAGSSDSSQSLTVSPAATTTAAANASVAYSGNEQSVPLGATVSSAAGVVSEGTETFTILSGTTPVGTPVAVSVVAGTASASYPLPAGTPVGTYTIQAVYNSTPDFVGSSDTSHTLTVSSVSAATATAVANASATYNAAAQAVPLTATVTSAGGTVNEGTLTFTILSGTTPVGNPVTVSVAEGAASASYALPAGTQAGTYIIQAVYNGTANFLSSTNTSQTLTVSAAASATAAVSASATFTTGAQDVSLSATVTSSAGTVDEGTETFTILSGTTVIGTPVTVDVVAGAASVSYALPVGTPAGTYVIEAAYSGTTNFLGYTDTSQTLVISAAATATAAASASVTFSTGSLSVPLTATVTSPAGTVNEGTETFTILNGTTVIGTPITVDVVAGAAATSYALPTGLSAGTYIIEAVYNGTTNFLGYTDTSQRLVIGAAATATAAASASATFTTGGQDVPLTATITSPAGTVNAGTETFTILSGTTVIGSPVTVNVVAGAAAASYALPAGTPAGTYIIEVVYNGSTDFGGSTDTTQPLIVGAAATATAAASASVTFNTGSLSVPLTATVTSPAGTVSEGTETFTILSGPTVIGTPATVNVIAGAAAASYALPAGTPAGTYIIEAVYNGSTDFGGSTDTTQPLVISAAATATAAASASVTFSPAAQDVPLTAAVTSPAGPVNEGTETFTILNGTTPVGTPVTVNVIAGAAAASYLLPADTPAGIYTIQAVYNGSPDFLGFTDTSHLLTVGASATATAAASASVIFSTAAQDIPLTATVTSPAGTVSEGTETFTILSGPTVIGTPVTVNVVAGAAAASYILPAGTLAGTYTIQAVYNGTVNFGGSSDRSQPLTITAAATATAAANASVTFSPTAQDVPLTATVSTPAGTVGEGTETFTILNGTTPVGVAVTANVVAGVADATYILPAGTPAGTYTIEAVYNGTPDFGGSSDTSRTLVVAAAATATAAASATVTFSTAAIDVPLLATVTSAAGTVGEGTEAFTILSGTTPIGASVTVNVVAGVASATYILPGGTPAGTYTIQAVYNGTPDLGGSSDSTHSLTVVAAALSSIAVTPAGPTIAKGLTVPFVAMGTYTDGSTADLTSQVAWASSDPSVASISPTGLATGLGVGSAGITASFDGVTSPVDTLTVTPAALTGIAVTPVNPSIAKGQTAQFTATGSYTDGTTADLTPQVTWASGTPAVASISPSGLAKGLGVGTSGITASLNGVTSPADPLTVTAAATATAAADASAPFSSAAQTVPLTATVTSPAGTVGAGTVTFTILNGNTPVGSPVTADVSGGVATADYPLPAGTPAATYTIQAVFSGTPDFSGSTDTSHHLTVSAATITVTADAVQWGSESAALQMASDGMRLLPAGRTTDLPWFNIDRIDISLSQAAPLNPGDVSVTGIAGGSYGPVTISGSGTSSVVITLAKLITLPDRVTLAIGNDQIITYKGRLDVLPGDVNDDGVVNTTDGALILYNETPAHAYQAFRDLNGDGAVDDADFALVRSRIGTVLPGIQATARSVAMTADLVDIALGAIDQDDFPAPPTSTAASVSMTYQTFAQKRRASSTGALE